MCKPLHFKIAYSINPWMVPGSADNKKAYSQWENLVNIYKKLKIKVSILDQEKDLIDMVFSADQGIIYNDKILLSRFRYKERQEENKPYRKWFIKQGFKIINSPSDVYFEGQGESLFFQDKLLIGIGFRANEKAVSHIEKSLGIKAVPLELVNPLFYHLDTCLFILNDITAFYYKDAFSKKSQKLLKKIVPYLIQFTKKEAYSFASNSIVTDHHVIMQKNIPTFSSRIKSFGYKPVEVDLGEFIKSGGASHCLTGVLQEE